MSVNFITFTAVSVSSTAVSSRRKMGMRSFHIFRFSWSFTTLTRGARATNQNKIKHLLDPCFLSCISRKKIEAPHSATMQSFSFMIIIHSIFHATLKFSLMENLCCFPCNNFAEKVKISQPQKGKKNGTKLFLSAIKNSNSYFSIFSFFNIPLRLRRHYTDIADSSTARIIN